MVRHALLQKIINHMFCRPSGWMRRDSPPHHPMNGPKHSWFGLPREKKKKKKPWYQKGLFVGRGGGVEEILTNVSIKGGQYFWSERKNRNLHDFFFVGECPPPNRRPIRHALYPRQTDWIVVDSRQADQMPASVFVSPLTTLIYSHTY